MPSRSERLFAALAARGADAFVSANRPNQLYLLDHPIQARSFLVPIARRSFLRRVRPSFSGRVNF
ncbi:MAG: hypothetical protein CME20_21905 [Gemmatimonadetes bacterium]|nr:hypothetical protein [Gemmatimonadota bacterium]